MGGNVLLNEFVKNDKMRGLPRQFFVQFYSY